jgi:ABC-type antimicrobial peptide transport system permease subunit
LALVFGQAAAIGFVGGAIGIASGYVLAETTERAAARWVSEVPFRPERFFLFDTDIILLGLTTALAAAVAGAFLPALRLLKDSPARVLSSVED